MLKPHIIALCEEYDDCSFEELCLQADMLGMCSLSEEEQVVMNHWHEYMKLLEEGVIA